MIQAAEILRRIRRTGFQTKFLLVIGLILVVFSGITALIIYNHELANLEENAFEKTDLIMKAIEADRDYIQEVLRPTMYEKLGESRFILEAMSSSYITRIIMERFNEKATGFVYRRVAVNAKNPDYEANGLETAMIDRFKAQPELKEWHGIIEQKAEKYFMRFQPVRFASSCLYCHGSPDNAPREIIAMYGEARGFHYALDEVAGVVSVGMPININLVKIKQFSLALFIGVVPSIVFVYFIISSFFNRYIAGNLRNILSFFRTNIKDEEGMLMLDGSKSTDEIDQLTATAKAIADNLHHKQTTLEKYANELLQSKNLLQSVFDGIADPVVLIDKRGRIKVVNAAFLRRNDLLIEQIINQRLSDVLKKEKCPLRLCEDIFDALPSRPVSREVSLETGEIFLVYFYPIAEGGSTESLVCYVKDITEQRKLEMKIQHTEKIASIGQLAAGIAHEINNPLGVILCHIDLIKGDDKLPQEIASDLEIIEKHAGNCRAIIADLLKFAHHQASLKEPASLNAIIEDIVSMVGSQLRKQKITVEMTLDQALPSLTVDADKIKQVILNLLINSAQAINKEGKIAVFTQHDRLAHLVRIIIEDSGPGIPANVIDKIFDPFFTTKAIGKGTGLGLSVSYGIIRDHDGEIVAESHPGKPTRFIISLPVLGEST